LRAAGVRVLARAHVTGNGNTTCKANLNPPENIFIQVIQIFGSEGDAKKSVFMNKLGAD
jgi:hypothetical protein